MVSRAFKLRVRRRFRIRKRQVEAFGVQTEEQLERNFFRRLERLREVRRFVAGWLLLVIMVGTLTIVQIRALGGYYQTLQPVPGGILNEGIVGSFTNANPVYATSSVDQAVSKLIFAGLYTYDDHNQLVGDLADGPLQVNADDTVYTAHLRPNLTWQDGAPLTAADVVYTFNVIQNPDAQSPLAASWQGIKVAALNATTVTFTLPDPLASFPYSLTTGIIPKHILGTTPMDEMRTVPFNTSSPVGAGPFVWRAIEVTGDSADNRNERIALDPFQRYHAGSPKLGSFVVHSYRADSDMVTAFEHQEINAMAGLDEVPAKLRGDADVHSYSLPLTASVMTFFRTTDGILSDTAVRKALVQSANVPAIITSLGYPAKAVTEPLLQGQLGYDASFAQPGFDLAAANVALDADGWKLGTDGIRSKANQPLTFKLYAQDTTEYAKVAAALKQQWRKAGVDLDVQLQGTADFQSTLTFHNYDALLYGISIGADPDVYAYWSSTQIDGLGATRLNFSEYKSGAVDASLQAGRTRTDPALRAIKYRSFLQSWQGDAPALGMYQPRFLYITRGPLFGLKEHYMNVPADRYDSVSQWMIRQVPVSQADTTDN
ncbi:MAG: ABC transporter substrate-binding protein [Candidatus Saccharibacteria bacterium]